MSPNDLFSLPEKEQKAGYDSLPALLQDRRSIREFKDVPVTADLTVQIIFAAQTAPI